MDKKIKFTIYAAAIILIIILLVSVTSAAFDMLGIGGGKDEIVLNIEEGSGLSSITNDLKSSGVINNKTAFKLYARLSGSGIYQMGKHTFDASMSYGKIIKELEKIPDMDSIKITIPEGFEIYRIADKLEEAGLINHDVFMRELEVGSFEYDFIKDIPSRENRLEGYLFPDTYIFSGTESEHDIINTMLASFERIVIPVYESSASNKSLDEIIKLASIIEREAANDNERGLVASVFVNRLAKNMRLESCATVQYILKERKSVLSNEDTRIDSPYNTYIYSGLPIGPIAAPGLKSIEAALNPSETNYLYFLARGDGSESLFSETFDEHLLKQQQIQN